MLKIRLQRTGRKKRPNYRIVVAEHSAPIQGRYVDLVGTYDPLVEKHGLVVDEAKVQEWIKKGAKPTNTVARLFKGKGMDGMDSFIMEMKDRVVKNPKDTPESDTAPAGEATESGSSEGGEAPAAESAPTEESAAPAEAPKAEVTEEAPAEAEKKEEVETPAEESKKEEEPAEEPESKEAEPEAPVEESAETEGDKE